MSERAGELSAATDRAEAAPQSVYLADLGATVHSGPVPQDLADELPTIYNSLFSTLDWFVTQGEGLPNGACVLEEPRHVVLFRRVGRWIDVLNKGFRCEPADAHRVCAALFRSFPEVRCLRLDVMFPPAKLGFPLLVRERLDRMVIDLPDTVDAYYHSLGKHTRASVRRRQNQLKRDFPTLKTEIIRPGGRSRELLDRLVYWKMERFARKGLLTYWDVDDRALPGLAELLSRRGEVLLVSVDGEEVAIQLTFRVGDTAYGFHSAFDPRFEPYSLGFLAFYWLICHAIESGASRLDALETYESFKIPLGARPVRATHVSVFRDRTSMVRSPREVYSVARERYWLARHAAGQWLRQSRRGKELAAFITRLRRLRLEARPAQRPAKGAERDRSKGDRDA